VIVAIAVVICACIAGVNAVPPEVKALEADVTIETSLMPISMKSHCYWDIDELKYRVDSSMLGMKDIQISDYNASIRYIIDEAFGQTQCRRCYLDDEMAPLLVPPIALPDGTDVVNGEVCDIWRLKWPMLDWSFCTQQKSPYAVLRTIMKMSNPAATFSTTMTFSNILVGKPPKAVFNTNNSDCDPPKCNAAVDVALLIDGSGSISSSDFALMKNFATMLATNLTIGKENANIGVIQFSDHAQDLFGLSADETTVVRGISNMQQMKSSTNMDEGLKTTHSVLMSTKRVVSQVMIMFTDGIPDSGNDPVAVAQTLKDDGIEIYTVGVGSDVNPDLLKKIASDDSNPLTPHYYQASSFSDLMDLLNNLVSAACKDDTCSNQQ